MEHNKDFEMSILLDTSVLIDFMRKTDKQKSLLVQLAKTTSSFFISSITEYELERGLNEHHHQAWESIKEKLNVLPFDSYCVREATLIYKELKTQNKLIDTADLLIAATALAHAMPLATLNVKDFERVSSLTLIHVKP